MTHTEIAQKIAEKIDTHTQSEVEAMMGIICDTTEIEMSWLFPVVSNLYAKINPSVMSPAARAA